MPLRIRLLLMAFASLSEDFEAFFSLFFPLSQRWVKFIFWLCANFLGITKSSLFSPAQECNELPPFSQQEGLPPENHMPIERIEASHCFAAVVAHFLSPPPPRRCLHNELFFLFSPIFPPLSVILETANPLLVRHFSTMTPFEHFISPRSE